MRELDALADDIGNRLTKSSRHLAKWARREAITCYRVYDRDIPEIPITIDTYNGDLVISDMRASDRGGGDVWLDAMVNVARTALVDGLDGKACFVKQRERLLDRRDQYKNADTPLTAWRTVHEGACAFRINLTDYIDVGLFLDHRTTRRMVAAETGKTMLNLFGYTGSFAVYAAKAGMHATTVDLSATYTEWAEDNLALNRLAGDTIQADVREYLKDARDAKLTWDVIVADVPTFSNSKRMDYTWDVQRDHAALLDDLRAICSPGGVIWFATNSRRFKPGDLAPLEQTHRTTPPDFKHRPHRSFRIAT
ncbi:MAG: class I SAM-dependent methyltransferase [Proteobacteria bacterium]|nr:class I SAM-dependent methyltransferase [Pseudomonadota bacterium]